MGLFKIDGPIITFLNTIGHALLVNILWLICCLPIVTIGPATISMYYAMIKSVRHGRGYPASEFLKSFKRTFLRGSLYTICIIGVVFLFFINREIVSEGEKQSAIWLHILYNAVITLFVISITFLWPVISRFDLAPKKQVQLSVVMGFKYLGHTILLISGLLLAGFIIYKFVPLGILFIPAGLTYLATFLIEPVLLKYMPPKQEDEDAWYYE